MRLNFGFLILIVLTCFVIKTSLGNPFYPKEDKPTILINNAVIKKLYVCSNVLIEINTTFSNEFNLKWIHNGTVISGQNTGTLFTSNFGKYSVIREYTNGVITESEPLEIVSGTPPDIHILSSKTSFCEGSEVILIHDNPGVGASWYLDGNRIGVNDTIVSKSGGTFKVQYGGLFGCSILENTIDIIKLNNPPTPSPNNLQFYTCPDRKFDLIVPENNNYNYEWFINDTSISNSNILSTSSFGIYQVRISDNNTNCSTLSNYFILSEDPNCLSGGIFLPDVVTQNEDGINDVLSIKNIENFTEYSIEIYNRWGALLTKQTSLEINNSLENIKFDYGQYLILVKNIFTSEIVMSKNFKVVK